MEQEPLKLILEGSIATVTLNRPEVHNAFEPRLITLLADVFGELSMRSDVRVIVLGGEGRSFCAGADLTWMREIAGYGRERNSEDARLLARMFRIIDHCPKPVVGRVHGAAIGGGMGLVATCDIAVASTRARFAFSEVRLGLAPAVISPFVFAKIGGSRCRELFLTARRFGPDEALSMGLVHRVVPETDMDEAISKVIQDLLAGGPAAQTSCKELLYTISTTHPDEVDGITAAAIAELRGGEEGQAGMSAFLKREPAPWTKGRPQKKESP